MYPDEISKPKDMQAACRNLEKISTTGGSRSARIQIPRVIAAAYELRNNRAIGHAGGEVTPNRMDGLLFRQIIHWLVCEFIRLQGSLNIDEAQAIIDGISVKWSSSIWSQGDKRRLLLTRLSIDDSTIAHLYFNELKSNIEQLRAWLEIKNIKNYKDRNLTPLHKAAKIHSSRSDGTVTLLPPGVNYFENKFSKELQAI